MTNGPGDWAASYVERLGWSVLPIWQVQADGSCGCGDKHLTNPRNVGKHPVTQCVPRGLDDSSSDVEVVREWWTRYPEANVAVNCSASGLLVIDVDPRHDGDRTWDELEARVDVPPTLRASTGGGGFHLLFRDAELRAAGARPHGRLGPGVDVKWNGYVLVAPSNHVAGRRYAWDTTGVSPVDLGPLLAEVSAGPAGSSGAGQVQAGGSVDLEALLQGIDEGSRHDAFKSFAARLRARRMPYVEARLMVEGAWARVEQPVGAEFPLHEALALLDWAWNLPEGTTAERELEAYAGYIATLTAPQPSSGNGHVAASVPELTLNDRITALPDALRSGVLEELRRREVRSLARSIVMADEFREPAGGRLDHLLLNGVPEPEFTIDRLHVRGTNTSLTAQFKTGKTTFQLNMMKALADGTPFLGHFDVRQLSGTAAFFNYELTEGQFVRWAGRLQIAHPEKIHVLNVRGLRLDLGDDYVREWVVRWLREREVEFWWIDPLARAYYGDENDNTALKNWTDHVDAVKLEAGVVDCQVSLHTGRGESEEGQERARGATRIDDWVDGRMVLTRQGEHRFIRAEGREVDVPEMMLVFDPDSHKLEVSHLTPVDRRVARQTQLSAELEARITRALLDLGAVTSERAVSMNAVYNVTRGNRNEVMATINVLVRDNVVQMVTTTRGNLCWVDRGDG